ncbi:hypothetical protein LEN26_014491 [Aphanomyces euteiches]|nr:hypothetical protein LEN26_014491 [Aphanomyces euteiches]KAH9115458.1 hypothetical protein AeMF1_010511 [Aphanomyces euteiches]KAH9183169.1 hypothetical protein AeNC1_014857 [Aphanomyces euteiches]
MKRKSMEVSTTIALTPDEEKLFALLLDVNKHSESNLTLRVAGGWVRDKLLGRSSDDIDIVLDKMTGAAFAQLVNEYESQHGHTTHAVGVIKANPDQSKHLETATMQLGNGWVDFVNLRSETYTDDEAHRIPTMAFGTPLEDAQRRDFTINSLFYNLSTQSVEDLTGHGLTDLAQGLIRTPLDPNITFYDDPLRVLRAIRFASRFQFPMADDLVQALRNPQIHEALKKKVSRERVGKELSGMLTGTSAHPVDALASLHEFGLLSSVFELPNGPYFVDQVQVIEAFDGWNVAHSCVRELQEWRAIRSASDNGLDDPHQIKLHFIAATLLPLADWTVVQKKKHIPVPHAIVRESIKFAAKDADQVGLVILKNFRRFVTESQRSDRVALGLLLRDVGELWHLCADMAYLYEVVVQGNIEKEAARQKYSRLAQVVDEQGLGNIWEMKPLLNGKEVMDALALKPGPAVKAMQDAMIVFQLQHPDTTREACLEHLQTLKK